MTKLLTAIWAMLGAAQIALPQVSDNVINPDEKSGITFILVIVIAFLSSYIGPVAIASLARGMQNSLKLGKERR